MSDADDLAQRYLALWTQYLTALLADPQAMETLKRWTSFTQQFSYPAAGPSQRSEPPSPVWPPFFGPFGMSPTPQPSVGERADGLAELAQRVDALERRLAELEQLPPRPRPRREAPKNQR